VDGPEGTYHHLMVGRALNAEENKTSVNRTDKGIGPYRSELNLARVSPDQPNEPVLAYRLPRMGTTRPHPLLLPSRQSPPTWVSPTSPPVQRNGEGLETILVFTALNSIRAPLRQF